MTRAIGLVLAVGLALAAATGTVAAKGSADLQWAQQVLKDKGFDVGKPNGEMTPKTRAALSSFQRISNLAVTGELDAATTAKLLAGRPDPSGGAMLGVPKPGHAQPAHDAMPAKPHAAPSARVEAVGGPAGEAVPFTDQSTGKLDLVKIKQWLEGQFEDPLWESIADICVGCGACAFICPACHCFDINDEGTADQGTRRKHWDACGFSKFTNHASGHNPRDIQNKRYRNRIMHKFKYYDDKFGKTLCTGCGRCIRACPVGIDIADILTTINDKAD